jgi:hypothetical protein
MIAFPCIGVLVGAVLSVRRWQQFRGYIVAMAWSAAYLVAWVILMLFVVIPAPGVRA